MPHIIHRQELSSKRIKETGWERFGLLGEENSELIGADFELLVLNVGETTPMHCHEDCEHYLFVLQGDGFLKLEDGEVPIAQNYLISIEPGECHAVRNSDHKKLEILEFLIPSDGKTRIVRGDE
ncbi:MAG: hypothetical protein A2Z14_14010 [Chloroflexi bacterium RBG_16_48_8]|nr:MAG: hypothetical protein A2Z14_14010 [Chloroflexi bacterium RBG_16_48_8]